MKAYEGKEPYIFISYAHKDSDTVLPILEALSEAGYRIWYDAGIEAGTEWPANIEAHLIQAEAVVVFISPNTVASRNCRNEIHLALNKNKEVLVIYLAETELKEGLGLQLSSIQSLFYHRYSDKESFLSVLQNKEMLEACLKLKDDTEPNDCVSVKTPKTDRSTVNSKTNPDCDIKAEYRKLVAASHEMTDEESLINFIFRDLMHFREQDVQKTMEKEYCRLYAKKVAEWIRLSHFADSLHLGTEVQTYEDCAMLASNILKLDDLNRFIRNDVMERHSDINIAALPVRNFSNMFDSALSSWCEEVIDHLNELDNSDIYYGKNISADPTVVLSDEIKEFSLLDLWKKNGKTQKEKDFLEKDLKIFDGFKEREEVLKLCLSYAPSEKISYARFGEAYMTILEEMKMRRQAVQAKLKRKERIGGFFRFVLYLITVVGVGLLAMWLCRNVLFASHEQSETVGLVWSNIWRIVAIIAGLFILMILVLMAVINVDAPSGKYDRGTWGKFRILPTFLPTLLNVLLTMFSCPGEYGAGYAVPVYITMGIIIICNLSIEAIYLCKYGWLCTSSPIVAVLYPLLGYMIISLCAVMSVFSIWLIALATVIGAILIMMMTLINDY